MNIDEVIHSRHSIREYQKKDVTYATIGEILESVKHSPSSGNIQNWQIGIIKEREKKEEIAKSCLNQLWMNQAPVHLILCYDERNIRVLYPKNYKEFSIQNIAILASFIMLKATTLGLGTCWIGIPKEEEIKKILKLPEFITPSVILTLGYSEGKYKKTTRNEVNELIFFEEYKNKRINTSIFPLSNQILKIKKKIENKIIKKN